MDPDCKAASLENKLEEMEQEVEGLKRRVERQEKENASLKKSNAELAKEHSKKDQQVARLLKEKNAPEPVVGPRKTKACKSRFGQKSEPEETKEEEPDDKTEEEQSSPLTSSLKEISEFKAHKAKQRSSFSRARSESPGPECPDCLQHQKAIEKLEAQLADAKESNEKLVADRFDLEDRLAAAEARAERLLTEGAEEAVKARVTCLEEGLATSDGEVKRLRARE